MPLPEPLQRAAAGCWRSCGGPQRVHLTCHRWHAARLPLLPLLTCCCWTCEPPRLLPMTLPPTHSGWPPAAGIRSQRRGPSWAAGRLTEFCRRPTRTVAMPPRCPAGLSGAAAAGRPVLLHRALACYSLCQYRQLCHRPLVQHPERTPSMLLWHCPAAMRRCGLIHSHAATRHAAPCAP